MRAVRVHEFGGPEVLVLEELPKPEPVEGEVLVRVQAAGVNPFETYVRAGRYTELPALPYTPGCDGAGVRTDTGERVFVTDSLSGTYAEYALCREEDVEDGVAETIAEMVEENWTDTALCAPFPDEEPDPMLLRRIVDALDANIGLFRQVGHNVIFPSLALKAFRDAPETITASRVEGVCKLIECFDTFEDFTLDDSDDIPDFGGPESMAEFVLAELLRTLEAFLGRGQGWSGHMVTSL